MDGDGDGDGDGGDAVFRAPKNFECFLVVVGTTRLFEIERCRSRDSPMRLCIFTFEFTSANLQESRAAAQLSRFCKQEG